MRAGPLLLVAALVWPWQSAMASGAGAAGTAEHSVDEAWAALQASRIRAGDGLLASKQAERAIREAFDPVIADFESRYAGSEDAYYCARTSEEGVAYLIHAAAEHDRGGLGSNALLVDVAWAYGHYGKAYALIELERPDEATVELDKALQLSPYNPQFLSERGHLYQIGRNWQQMLGSHLSAAEFTAIASPEGQRDIEHARALRGQGFALIELDRLQDAEDRFLESLELDASSLMARNELDYIQRLRSKAKQATGIPP